GTMTVDVNRPGKNQRARLLARFDEAFFDEKRVEPLPARGFHFALGARHSALGTEPLAPRHPASGTLGFPVNDPTRDVGETRIKQPGALERLVGLVPAFGGQLARSVESEERGIG